MATQKETTRKRDKSVNFRQGLRTMLAQIHPDISVQTEALAELSNIAVFLGKKISHGATTLLPEDTKTISARAVMLAADDLYGEYLGKHAISEMEKAVARYESAKEGKEGSRSSKAKLQISIARSERVLREHSGCSRVSEKAAVALAAAIEYFMGEIIELAGNAARDNKKVRISVKHITLAIQHDAALFRVVGKGVFSGAGVTLVSIPVSTRRKTRKTSEKASSKKKASPSEKKKSTAAQRKKSVIAELKKERKASGISQRKKKVIAELLEEREGRE
uniref:Histone H2B-H2A fusion protein n=1 Tax=Marseillevirus sp. TaxID=2809551 RepID=A0AA96ENB0_9VIRU|nr:histone H2B-H2A fusion protein [Marseillevirus sp.]